MANDNAGGFHFRKSDIIEVTLTWSGVPEKEQRSQGK